jgi:DNA-binding transcriptional LysR family regulator
MKRLCYIKKRGPVRIRLPIQHTTYAAVTPRNIKEVDSAEGQLLCVEFGLGVAIVNHISRVHGNQNFLFVDVEDVPARVAAVWKKNNPNPRVRLLSNIMEHF